MRQSRRHAAYPGRRAGLAPDNVRVNIIHPNAVFDTKLWTPEALQRSAERYGLTVEQYKKRNLMKCEITSRDIGMMVASMAGPLLRQDDRSPDPRRWWKTTARFSPKRDIETTKHTKIL